MKNFLDTKRFLKTSSKFFSVKVLLLESPEISQKDFKQIFNFFFSFPFFILFYYWSNTKITTNNPLLLFLEKQTKSEQILIEKLQLDSSILNKKYTQIFLTNQNKENFNKILVTKKNGIENKKLIFNKENTNRINDTLNNNFYKQNIFFDLDLYNSNSINKLLIKNNNKIKTNKTIFIRKISNILQLLNREIFYTSSLNKKNFINFESNNINEDFLKIELFLQNQQFLKENQNSFQNSITISKKSNFFLKSITESLNLSKYLEKSVFEKFFANKNFYDFYTKFLFYINKYIYQQIFNEYFIKYRFKFFIQKTNNRFLESKNRVLISNNYNFYKNIKKNLKKQQLSQFKFNSLLQIISILKENRNYSYNIHLENNRNLKTIYYFTDNNNLFYLKDIFLNKNDNFLISKKNLTDSKILYKKLIKLQKDNFSEVLIETKPHYFFNKNLINKLTSTNFYILQKEEESKKNFQDSLNLINYFPIYFRKFKDVNFNSFNQPLIHINKKILTFNYKNDKDKNVVLFKNYNFLFNSNKNNLLEILKISNDSEKKYLKNIKEIDFRFENEILLSSNFLQNQSLKKIEKTYLDSKKSNDDSKVFTLVAEQSKNLNQYKQWIFTPNWWNLIKNLIVKNILLISDESKNNFYNISSNKPNYSNLITKNYKQSINDLVNLLLIKKDNVNENFSKKIPIIFVNRTILRINQEINNINKEKVFRPQFKNHLILVNKYNSYKYLIFYVIIGSFFVFKNYKFYTISGFSWFFLWKKVENLKLFKNPSWNNFLDLLIYQKTLDETKHIENIWLKKSKKFFYNLLKKYRIQYLIDQEINADLLKNETLFLSDTLITNKQLNFYKIETKQKILENKNFFNSLSYIYKNSIFPKWNSKEIFNEKIIIINLYEKILSSSLFHITQNNTFYNETSNVTNLDFSKGILLLGKNETEKSEIIKTLASNAELPIIQISAKILASNSKMDSNNSQSEQNTESEEYLQKLKLTIKLVQRIAPCIVWIPNIHEFHYEGALSLTQSATSLKKKKLFVSLINELDNLFKHKKKSILIFASSDFVKKIDPLLLSPDRFGRLVNVRTYTFEERQKKLDLLLKNKNLKFKNQKLLEQLSRQTVGYNYVELNSLKNEIGLIAITENKKVIEENNIKLSFYRQIYAYINTTENFSNKSDQKLIYKIGKTVISKLIIPYKSIFYINNQYDWWKKKFYFLSKFYFELPYAESVLKEVIIICNALVCLAGYAAQDYYNVNKNSTENKISLNQDIENDLTIIYLLFQKYFEQFGWIGQFTTNLKHNKRKKSLNNDYIFENLLFSHNKKLSRQSSYKINNSSKFIEGYSFFNKNIFKNRIFYNNNYLLHFYSKYKNNIQSKNTNLESNSNFSFSSNDLSSEDFLLKVTEPYKRLLFSLLKEITNKTESEIDKFLNNINEDLLNDNFLDKNISSNEYQNLSDGKNNLIFKINRKNLLDRSTVKKLYSIYGILKEEDFSYPSRKIRKNLKLSRFKNITEINNTDSFVSSLTNNSSIKKEYSKDYFGTHLKIGSFLNRTYWDLPTYLHQPWSVERKPDRLNRLQLMNNFKLNKSIKKQFDLDLKIHQSIVELYFYLLKFFKKNNKELDCLIEDCVNKKLISMEKINQKFTKK